MCRVRAYFTLGCLALGCRDGWVRLPGASALAPADGGAEIDAGPVRAVVLPFPEPLPAGQRLGPECGDDSQCDDDLECTRDRCDAERGRCIFVGEDAACADGQYCNGAERCDPRLGCVAGPPVSCSDATPCTIDLCDEETRSCIRLPRDADADGAIDINCPEGNDCDDGDPGVSGDQLEVCGNSVDDNCDGQIDEATCSQPQHDACGAALRVSAPVEVDLRPAGAALDFAASCGPDGERTRDLFVEVEVPAGGQRDLDLLLRSAGARLAIAELSGCPPDAAELSCSAGISLATGVGVARLRAPGIAAGIHRFALYTDSSAPLRLEGGPTQPQGTPGGSCEAPAALAPSQRALVHTTIADPPDAAALACGEAATAAQHFGFTLDEPSDVRVYATGLDGVGTPLIELSPGCGQPPIACGSGQLQPIGARNLPPGTYQLAVAATGPEDVEIALEARPTRPAPASDACESGLELRSGQDLALDFTDHFDSIEAGCLPGGLDAAARLTLSEESDVLLLGSFSPSDAAAVTLSGPTCDVASQRSCSVGSSGRAAVAAHGLPAGGYRAVVESRRGLPAVVTAAVRPASTTTLAAGADGCESPLVLSPAGGRYRGSTANSTPSLSASCDFALPIGAPDQLLQLELPEARRVIIDGRDSDFDVLLNLRRGPGCPGEEVVGGCITGALGRPTLLDLDLPAGTYFLQVDGYAGVSGSWALDVYVL